MVEDNVVYCGGFGGVEVSFEGVMWLSVDWRMGFTFVWRIGTEIDGGDVIASKKYSQDLIGVINVRKGLLYSALYSRSSCFVTIYSCNVQTIVTLM